VNVIVVGASYRNASVDLLDRLSLANGPKALEALLDGPHVAEAVLLSTCNRVEIYAAVPAFHAGLSQLGEVLAELSGIPAATLADSLYVHHGVDAVRHVFRVAAGLDSMVVGEPQILGQLRDAYQQATELDAADRVLHELMQQALRVGKRAHAETGIDSTPRSMVSSALDVALGAEPARRDAAWLVIGAGAMGALSVAELTRRDIGQVTVVNRDSARAVRLAEIYGCQTAELAALPELLARTDFVITATASVAPVLTAELVRAARSSATGPLTILDLALPRDVEPAVGSLAGIELIDVERLGAALGEPAELIEVERLVAQEVSGYETWLRGADVAPTVAALRIRADQVVAAELGRLAQRRIGLTDDQRAEVAHTVHRVVQRLLHSPTVRVRQLAAEPGGAAYASLLRDLFDLDPQVATIAEIPQLDLDIEHTNDFEGRDVR
jgi:glutamyl-tRNA reductase